MMGQTDRQTDRQTEWTVYPCLSRTDNRKDGLTDSDTRPLLYAFQLGEGQHKKKAVCHAHDNGYMTHVAYKVYVFMINHASISHHFLNSKLTDNNHGLSPTSPILVAPAEGECHKILKKIRFLTSQVWNL